MSIEALLEQIILKSPIGRGVLYLLSLPYAAAVKIRNLAYDLKLLPRKTSPIPVVSIGNIAAGGTGKTPFVHYLARELSQKRKIAILTRGYRSKLEHAAQPKQITEKDCATVCGDEPLLLKKLLPNVDVWVGKRRDISSDLALKQGAQLLLLDDGMQYRKLRRQCEIVCLDATDPLAKGYFLPRGMLRDDPKRLKQANILILNNCRDEKHFEQACALLKTITQAPIVGTRLKIDGIQFSGEKVAAFCAIAKPHRFLESLKECGAEVISQRFKEDHRTFSPQELTLYAQEAKQLGAKYLLCTEKDFIKLSSSINLELPIFPLKTEIEIVYGREEWYDFYQKMF